MNRRAMYPNVEHSSTPRILLIDSRAARRGQLARLVANSRPTTVVAEYSCGPDALPDYKTAACAFLAAEDALTNEARFEDRVRSLRREDLPVAGYADGASTWPLAFRCQLLLWGVHPLLDSALPDFHSEFRRVVSTRLSRMVRSRTDTLSIREQLEPLGIVAHSGSMLRVLAQVERLAHLSDLPVLISGETGTGKELIARALHGLDARRRGVPMIALNCGALPSSLAEAELFGHARGAFSGADRQRKGLIRAANGSVLLFDEIGELELGLQTRLLRVLQEGRVRPLGDDQETAVDIRVVAATHRDLPAMVRAGTFREDLYHRLSVAPVRVPPLRERVEDVAPLVHAFLTKHRAIRRTGPATATPDFVTALASVELPGNVRQLENIVRCALAQAEHDEPLGLANLPANVWSDLARVRWENAPEASKAAKVASSSSGRELNLARCVAECERAALQAALARAQGSRTEAARILGISSRGVYNKIRKYRLLASS